MRLLQGTRFSVNSLVIVGNEFKRDLLSAILKSDI